jgi:iron complex transport system permease protein
LLGVSTGCSLGAVVVIILGWSVPLGVWSLPLFAFVAGMLTLLAVFRIASVGGAMRVESLILAGVIMNAFLSAVLSLLLIVNKNEQSDILFWLMGSLSLKGWSMVLTLSPYVLVGIISLWYFSRVLNLFSLGDSHAFYTGVNVGRHRFLILCLSSLTAAACVSICGTVGFVGLIVPHMIRLINGPDHKFLIPLSALAGGSLVLWGDNLARLVISPEELPLGVITAFLGAPFFIFLLRRRVKGGRP